MKDRPDLVHICQGHEKWDALVLTAGNEKHVEAFQVQIKNEPGIYKLVERVFVIKDEPENVKIGSGGATLHCLDKLYKEFNENLYNLRIILIHSGGYSQRLPHVSALGKVFLLMPNGLTFLEMKIRSYENVLRHMSSGILICASDTFEWFSSIDLEKSGDFTLFAHESTIEIAEQHGVYIVDGNSSLKSVLQKPSEEEMKNTNAIQENGLALTDGCYIIHKNIIQRLLELRKKNGNVSCEVCAYGDFMRPLGSEPILDYLNVKDQELAFWRSELKNSLTNLNTIVINLGPQSFFHLGTIDEMLRHFDPNSIFGKKFLRKYECSNILYSDIEHPEMINPKTFVQYCAIKDKSQKFEVVWS
uniref:L-fucokinase domain-containing protein n=1 Tax=Acrobeloides nanus TaxID=290746 RepID=A0A914E1B1_9BILA